MQALRAVRRAATVALRPAQRSVRRRTGNARVCLSTASASGGGGGGGEQKQKPPPRKRMGDFEIFESDAEETLVFGHFTGGFSVCGDEVWGSMLLLPRAFFGWTVTDVGMLTEESLSFFWLHNPKPDVLLVGTGETLLPLDPALTAALRARGIRVDVMSTVNAAATFNILNTEQRNVAAALIALKE